jgi:hypothetical protein
MRTDQQAPRLLANLEKAIAMVPWASDRVKVLRGRMPAYRERVLKTTP